MLQVYIGLLVVAVGTMGLIGVYRAMNKRTEVVRDYADIRREGILRFVAEYERPGSYVAVDDTALQGFQYELSRAIARYAGLEMEMHFEMSLENSFDGLRDGRYDIVARNLPTTDELKADYFLTDPILTDRQVLVQRRDTARLLRNQLDLAGHTIVVPRESPAILRLENLRCEMADTFRIVEDPLYSSEQLIAMVAAGDIDYTVCDRRVAAAALELYPEIDINTDIGFTQLHAWAVRRTSPVLRDSINAWFARMHADGTFDRILRKYYPAEDAATDRPSAKKDGVKAVAPVGTKATPDQAAPSKTKAAKSKAKSARQKAKSTKSKAKSAPSKTKVTKSKSGADRQKAKATKAKSSKAKKSTSKRTRTKRKG